jgi:hypothetical protein
MPPLLLSLNYKVIITIKKRDVLHYILSLIWNVLLSKAIIIIIFKLKKVDYL